MKTTFLEMQLEADAGSGRAFVVVYDETAYSSAARALHQALASSSRALLIRSPKVDDTNWHELGLELQQRVTAAGIRQASYVSFGAGAALVQHLALEEPKMVRTLAVIDATARPHPSRFTRLVDKIERWLPLGLPLRSGAKGFDVRPHLHRIRCPLLVVSSGMQASGSDAAVLADGAPTAWQVQAGPLTETQGLCETILSFQDVPAKCPQKNL